MWVDEAFPAAPAESERVAICAEMRTPPALTGLVAEDGPRATLLLGFTDADDRVALREWDGADFVAPVGGAVVDPSPAGISLAPVGLAHSDADGVAEPVVMAVWSAEDSRTEAGQPAALGRAGAGGRGLGIWVLCHAVGSDADGQSGGGRVRRGERAFPGGERHRRRRSPT
jgi:hypothetical protein